jgi:acyl-CoA-dependent ceramide synthase
VSVWVYLRHYINLKIIWAVLTEFRTVGPFELNWETQQYKCWISQYITFSLLASLQAVNLFWLFLILRILYNYLSNSVTEDERSDNEEEEDDDVAADTAKGVSTAVSNNGDQARQRAGAKDNATPQVLVNGSPVDAPAANGKKY